MSYFVLVLKSNPLPLYYAGWLASKEKTCGQWSHDPALAKGYGSLHQARIGRTKLLKFRIGMSATELVIEERMDD